MKKLYKTQNEIMRQERSTSNLQMYCIINLAKSANYNVINAINLIKNRINSINNQMNQKN